MKKELKISKLAIASFIFSLIPLLIFIFILANYFGLRLNGWSKLYLAIFLFILILLISFISIILSIFSLSYVKKYKLKGKLLAIFAIIISAIPPLCFAFIFFAIVES
jgi:hypothetical protein